MQPYDLALLEWNQGEQTERVVQIISKPWMESDGVEVVNVRMVPGDVTTLFQVEMTVIQPVRQHQRYCHVAEVRSNLSFPEDMLRYDCCYLYDHNIRIPESGLYFKEGRLLVYRVTNHKEPRWTEARWSSFLCPIEHLNTIDLNERK